MRTYWTIAALLTAALGVLNLCYGNLAIGCSCLGSAVVLFPGGEREEC